MKSMIKEKEKEDGRVENKETWGEAGVREIKRKKHIARRGIKSKLSEEKVIEKKTKYSQKEWVRERREKRAKESELKQEEANEVKEGKGKERN